MPFKNKDPKKGTKITVDFDAKENKKIERHVHRMKVKSKADTVKKMIRDFPEEKD